MTTTPSGYTMRFTSFTTSASAFDVRFGSTAFQQDPARRWDRNDKSAVIAVGLQVAPPPRGQCQIMVKRLVKRDRDDPDHEEQVMYGREVAIACRIARIEQALSLIARRRNVTATLLPIVGFYGEHVVSDGPQPTTYLAMSYESHGSLEKYISQYDLSNGQFRWLARQLVSALDFLRGLGIAHRDIKAGNVLLARDHVKLCDFGWSSCNLIPAPYAEHFAVVGEAQDRDFFDLYVMFEKMRCPHANRQRSSAWWIKERQEYRQVHPSAATDPNALDHYIAFMDCVGSFDDTSSTYWKRYRNAIKDGHAVPPRPQQALIRQPFLLNTTDMALLQLS